MSIFLITKAIQISATNWPHQQSKVDRASMVTVWSGRNGQCSLQVRRLLAFDEIEIDLSADARHLRATRKAIPADLDVLEQRVFVRTVRQQIIDPTRGDLAPD